MKLDANGTPEGFVDLDSARQSRIDSTEELPSLIGKGDEKDRLYKVAASLNSHNLTEDRLEQLEKLRAELLSAPSLSEKISILDAIPSVRRAMETPSFFRSFLVGLTPECEYAFKQLAAIDQVLDVDVTSAEKWRELLSSLLNIERYYAEIGGIVGYQVEALKRLKNEAVLEEARFHSPVFDDISNESKEVQEAIAFGLKSLPELAEFYPLGGAADRLHLVDSKTGVELPAAKLNFAGRTLLESLIRDLQAREWLYFRLYGKQLITPIAVMTSWEKENYRHVLKVCEENNWFGRPKDRFRFFVQPLVPAFDEQGNWHTLGPLKPLLKPGGHGALWKCARDEGIFSWLKSLGCKKALIRQINNPIAGMDYGLIAFAGIGCKRNASFGFVSCNRIVKSAEGMIVLVEKKSGEIVLTNVEYCDFSKFGIADEPLHPGQPYSRFTSNTNILFADLEAVEKAVQTHPFPGLLMNLKSATIHNERGERKQAMMARLESTMQNIADSFVERAETPQKTFAVYNRRHKTISVAKKAYTSANSLLETPECCFYELLSANRDLLTECGFTLPSDWSAEEYLKKGPSSLFLYHPALGPLYSIIRQKLRAGSIALGSELLLEIAELDLSALQLDGSLQIQAHQLLGALPDYSHKVGQCSLHNVTVRNQGVDWEVSAPYWKMELQRKETLLIELKGHSEFEARDVVFSGAHHFVVEDGKKMIVSQNGDGTFSIRNEPISDSPFWHYANSESPTISRGNTK